MDQALSQILTALGLAAVCVERGQIVWSTPQAEQLGLCAGTPLGLLLPPDMTEQELACTRQLSLPRLGPRIWAQVIPLPQGLLLAVQEDGEVLGASALAQTSRVLRSPLNDLFITSAKLFARLEDMEDPGIQRQTAKMNRNFYQLLRTVNALSDRSGAEAEVFYPRTTELCEWLECILAPAASALAACGRELHVEYPATRVFADIDAVLLEQALWCLLSNAVRYSPAGSRITLQLQPKGGSLFTLRNPVAEPVPLQVLSDGFIAPLTPESGDHGLGLGLMRTRQILSRHGSALLLQNPPGEFIASFRLPPQLTPNRLRTAVPIDRSGGHPQMLVELSEVLPDTAYDSRNL